MTRTDALAAPATRRVRRLVVLGLAAVLAVITTVLGHQGSKSPPASASSSPPDRPLPTGAPAERPGSGPRASAGRADGVVPEGVSVFDDAFPAVNRLDPDLLKALRRAARDAADAGVEFHVNSGWRSPAYQNRLLREAVSQYGSEEEASRWVATAATSPHVSGDAVDVGRSEATTWLSRHGAAYGLCRIYGNEPWHYELRAEAIGSTCPPMFADPTQDPRMRR
ncbi:M15 family metallopeptidase (plasmid) [Streptomyces sp. CA-294286]|uniref:M15 family metallopeptidase n=1 Tax=Streptomyces sp. CA-294286 TaxID=3240070 RepID=UPI003D8A95B9